MPHACPRLILRLLLNRLRHSPIVAIQGARQTGKSFLSKILLKTNLPKSIYISLDLASEQQLAQTSPQVFLTKSENAKPLIIDEAQKSPELFDALKYSVDENRIPGRFLILGSTEFSILQNIRESLTGRLARVRLYPMIARELFENHSKKIDLSRSQLLNYSLTGGMPAIAFVRDAQLRANFFQDWIELTCKRDIHQFKRLKLDGDLALLVFRECAIQHEPTQANLAKALRVDSRRIATHLNALCDLFALIKLDPHPSGTGKSIYLPLDAGIAGYLGANETRRLQILLMNERMAMNAYFGKKRNIYYYYRSSGKKIIHLVEEELDGQITAFQIFERERIKKTDLELLKAFHNKNKKSQIILFAPVNSSWKEGNLVVQPWEKMIV